MAISGSNSLKGCLSSPDSSFAPYNCNRHNDNQEQEHNHGQRRWIIILRPSVHVGWIQTSQTSMRNSPVTLDDANGLDLFSYSRLQQYIV